jgi:alpha-L-rhamnosidase
VISFFHRHVSGIQLTDEYPGYRNFRLAPRPGGGLTWAEAVHDSPYRRIESSWRIGGSQIRLTVTVPAGTTAEIHLPGGDLIQQKPGRGTYECVTS